MLQERVAYARTLTVQAIDLHRSQVTGTSSLHVVNLTEKTCSCRRFDLEKLPCAHAIAAAEASNGKTNTISQCHPHFKRNYLCNSYSTSVMPEDDALPVSDAVKDKVCLPPVVRQPPGRPKKSRFKSVLEKAVEKKRPRKQHACSRCNQVGHNCKTCPSTV